ncbi:uncharacterized protein LOC142330549 [Lycorma delicatula]|uniref:uncharacterized protein LOC142330549 n=1 Tax=Lycorma delicatula TaxID=130591 RepID=UPI003F50DBCF
MISLRYLLFCYLNCVLIKINYVYAHPVPISDIKQKRSLLQFSNYGQSPDYQQYDNNQYDSQPGGFGLSQQPQQTQAKLWLRNVFDTITDLVIRGLYENFPKRWTKRKLLRLKNVVVRKFKPIVMKLVRSVLGRKRKAGRSLS